MLIPTFAMPLSPGNGGEEPMYSKTSEPGRDEENPQIPNSPEPPPPHDPKAVNVGNSGHVATEAESIIAIHHPITDILSSGLSGNPIDKKPIPNSQAANGIARMIPYFHITPKAENNAP